MYYFSCSAFNHPGEERETQSCTACPKSNTNLSAEKVSDFSERTFEFQHDHLLSDQAPETVNCLPYLNVHLHRLRQARDRQFQKLGAVDPTCGHRTAFLQLYLETRGARTEASGQTPERDHERGGRGWGGGTCSQGRTCTGRETRGGSRLGDAPATPHPAAGPPDSGRGGGPRAGTSPAPRCSSRRRRAPCSDRRSRAGRPPPGRSARAAGRRAAARRPRPARRWAPCPGARRPAARSAPSACGAPGTAASSRLRAPGAPPALRCPAASRRREALARRPISWPRPAPPPPPHLARPPAAPETPGPRPLGPPPPAAWAGPPPEGGRAGERRAGRADRGPRQGTPRPSRAGELRTAHTP